MTTKSNPTLPLPKRESIPTTSAIFRLYQHTLNAVERAVSTQRLTAKQRKAINDAVVGAFNDKHVVNW